MEQKNNENCWSNTLKKPYFTYVWAEDQNGLIGREGRLPWSLPNEMKHFVNVTIGDVVVMGRKTYESIPNRPLKDRVNIVLTTNKDYQADEAIIVHTKEEIMNAVRDIEKPIHIIGGTTLFEMFIDEVNLLYRTIVYSEFEGDTYMPPIDYKHFKVVKVTPGNVDAKNIYPHDFFLYERKKFTNPFH